MTTLPLPGLPFPVGTLHFIGIGGIGMSGIAEVMKKLGGAIQGSDLAENANVRRLRALGIPVAIGHAPENLGDAAVVVISSAVRRDNPELAAARAAGLPVVRRAEMLAELMRFKWAIAIGGTHGKTTTTSLVGAVLEGAGVDPTVINGGIINAYGTNTRMGDGDWMVVEADESDGTFLKLPATVAVVTNIDPEHLDHYETFENVRRGFQTFVDNIPFYGFAVLCLDHPEVQALLPKVADRRLITYGFSPQADVRAVNVRLDNCGVTFDAVFAGRLTGAPRTVESLVLPMLGHHNVQNALAALAVAAAMGLEDAAVRQALAGFSGVKRRFTCTGVAQGITIIDDYGHHPVEIAAVLKAARTATRDHKTIAVVQPHRYSRLASLFEEFCTCFNDADVVVVADVYAAGETPQAGIGRDALVEGLRLRGHKHVLPLSGPEALAPLIRDLAAAGDFVVCLGAGNITTWAQALPGDLESLMAGNRVSAPQGEAA